MNPILSMVPGLLGDLATLIESAIANRNADAEAARLALVAKLDTLAGHLAGIRASEAADEAAQIAAQVKP